MIMEFYDTQHYTRSIILFRLSSQAAGSGISGLPPKTSARWEQTIQTEVGKPLDLICSAVGNPPLHFR